MINDEFKKTKIAENGRFADFFLHATEEKKEKVFREAARQANEEQRELIERSRFKTKTS